MYFDHISVLVEFINFGGVCSGTLEKGIWHINQHGGSLPTLGGGGEDC